MSKLLTKLIRHQGATLLSSQQVPVVKAVMVSVSVLQQSTFRAGPAAHVPHCCPLFSAAQAQMGMDVGTNTCWPKQSPDMFARCHVEAGLAQSYSACPVAAEQMSLAKTVSLPSIAFLCSFNKHDGNANRKFFSAWLCLVFFCLIIKIRWWDLL